MYGDTNGQVANALINFGDVQLARRDFVASVKTYEDAVMVTTKTSGPSRFRYSNRRNENARSRRPRRHRQHSGQPYAEDLVHVAHARALYEQLPSRRAKAARDVLAGSGARPEELAEGVRWLDTHR